LIEIRKVIKAYFKIKDEYARRRAECQEVNRELEKHLTSWFEIKR